MENNAPKLKSSFFFFFFFFSPLHWSNILIAVVEAEMLRISDGIPDCGSPTIQTSCNYGSGDHGLAFGLSRSSWIVRGRSSTCTFDGVETVRCIEPPLLPSSHFHAFFFFYRLCTLWFFCPFISNALN